MHDDVIFALIILAVVAFWAALILLILRLRRKQRGNGAETARKAPLSAPERRPDAALSPEELDALLARVAENTRCESLRATLLAQPSPGLFSSKVGGLPYWDPAVPYPADREGSPLALLAQIDLSELPETGLLPGRGLLQFFIRPDDMYGMDFDARDDQDGFRVVFHAAVDRGVTEEMIRAMDLPTSFSCGDALPHCGEFALAFRRETVRMGIGDCRFDAELRRAAEELGLRLPEGFSPLEAMWRDQRYDDWFSGSEGTRLLGYPYFVQEDPRTPDTPYDTLLFQLDSCFASKAHPDSAPERCVIWGDAGVGNFFIRGEDLAAERFDRVYYTWDCG